MRRYLIPISSRRQFRIAKQILLIWLIVVLVVILHTPPRYAPWSYLLFLTVIPAGFLAWRAFKNGWRLLRAERRVWFGR